ncbi:putative antirestriction adenine methyltransferase [Peribacillus asahii]|uniref:putative antirestriction adenine methyltransferase n=1 Tax=Peribacillus asahii TaxID=228899 RepID=UPI00207B05A8|nr:hypothetical protein [Peribacillus asahii]USK72667.1 hypothetical protein LIS76_23380 [Peribacillus asahii]USK72704.1 hypothetical protein LIS76_23960 [Peribacillus asahii]
MFVGSINSDLRALVSETTRYWESTDIYIGCSGNFTIERILKGRDFNLHGNDVSLYTSAIGNYLAGNDMHIGIKQKSFEWLEPYMNHGIERIATLLLCTTMLDGYHRTEPYFTRKREAYHDQWERLHSETCAKVQKGLENMNVVEYWMGDVVEWAINSPKDQAFISFPPTYKGGYEKLYQAFEEVFDWQEPEYELFDNDRLEIMLEAVKEKKEWMMARDEPMPALEGYEIGTVQTSLRSKPVTVYASKSHKRITMPHQKTEVLKVKRANENTEFNENSHISLRKITQAQMNTLRSLYLNPGIAPASAAVNFAVLVDGHLIGAMGLSKSQYSVGEGYVMSDFVIRPVKYKRLSKLVLACVLSKEVKLLLEQALNGRVKALSTTAFTDKPISMKYRGLFEVHSRKEGRVNYTAPAGKWTLQEGYQWWWKKHSNSIN